MTPTANTRERRISIHITQKVWKLAYLTARHDVFLGAHVIGHTEAAMHVDGLVRHDVDHRRGDVLRRVERKVADGRLDHLIRRGNRAARLRHAEARDQSEE